MPGVMFHMLIPNFIWLLLVTEHTMCSLGNLLVTSTPTSNRTLSLRRQSGRVDSPAVRSNGTVHATSHIPDDNGTALASSSRLNRLRKNSYRRLPSVAECIADQFNYAILKGCLCYLFQSTGLNGGLFRSPDEDFFRERKLSCLIFTFVGDVNEIVRLDLSQFSIQRRTYTHLSDTKCEYYVRIFTHLERAELNLNDVENHRLCGHWTQLPQNVFYSVGRVLILQMHISQNFFTGASLHGSYRFEDKSWYQNDGLPLPDTRCDRLFLSPNYKRTYPSEAWAKETGRFFSPTYPQNYPPNVTCNYYFLGNSNEEILLSLYDIFLHGDEPCSKHSRGDRITISEFTILSQPSAVMLPQVIGKSEKQNPIPLRIICFNTTAMQIAVESPGAVLQFVSMPESATARGFKGRFRFVSRPRDTNSPSTRIEADHTEDSDAFDAQSEESYGSEEKPIIKQIWMNKQQRNGLIESPNYPNTYPANLEVVYKFHIPAYTKLTLEFFDFRLNQDYQSIESCVSSGGDRLEFYDGSQLTTQPRLILCGNQVPDNLHNQVSPTTNNQASMRTYTLRFVSDEIATGNGRGFLLSYTYESVQLTATTAFQPTRSHPESAVLPTVHKSPPKVNSPPLNIADCQYTIKSNGRDMFGKLPLPQHLPIQMLSGKQTMSGFNSTCRWQLQGNPGQRIRLRLVRRTRTDASQMYPSDNSFIQHDEEFGSRTVSISQTDSKSMKKTTLPPFRQLRCPTPLTVELVNYLQEGVTELNTVHREQSPAISDLNGSIQPLYKDPRYPIQSQLVASDPILFCADESATASPAGKGFMSGHIPRMDILLRLNRPILVNGRERDAQILADEVLNLDYDIEYQFVTDYGVIAPFGHQRKPGCQFEFNLSVAARGNFSSPNYPGLYPIDITCEYRFFGTNVKKIEIEFIEFDVESASKTCSDARMGDFVELRSCYPLELLTYPKRRLCHQQTAENRYRIEWYEPCVLLKFFSNEHFAGTGFLGMYTFHTSGQCASTTNILLGVTFVHLWTLFYYAIII